MTKSLGEVFSSAWGTVKKNFVALFVPTAIYMGILFLLYGINYTTMIADMSLVTVNSYIPSQMGSMWFLPVMLAVTVFFSPLYSAYITAVLRTYRVTGMSVIMRMAWKAACANYTKYLLTMLTQLLFGIVFGIIVGIVFAIMFFVSAINGLMTLFSYSADIWNALEMFFSAILPAMIVVVILGWLFRFSLTFVQFVPGMENKQGFKALFSGVGAIYQGKIFKNLGYILLAELIQTLIIGLIAVIFFLPFFMNIGMNADLLLQAGHLFDPLLWGMPLYMLIGGLVSILLSVFFVPYYFEVYLNAKIEVERKEAAKCAAAAMRYPYQGQ